MSEENNLSHIREHQYTREEVESFLADIANKVVESQGSYLHSVLALNHLMQSTNAHEIFDENLKQQARDLWLKIRASGFQLTNPPLLFGVPDAASE